MDNGRKGDDSDQTFLDDVVRVLVAKKSLSEFERGQPGVHTLQRIYSRIKGGSTGIRTRRLDPRYPNDWARAQQTLYHIKKTEQRALADRIERHVSNDYSNVKELTAAMCIALATNDARLIEGVETAAEAMLPNTARRDFEASLKALQGDINGNDAFVADYTSKHATLYSRDSCREAINVRYKAIQTLREIFNRVEPRQQVLDGLAARPIDPVDVGGKGRR